MYEDRDIDMSKINLLSRRNKVDFNEAKSKTMLISRRKRKEAKDIKTFLNNKPIEQVTAMKLFTLGTEFRVNLCIILNSHL